jgi:hypothetical protein
MNMRKLTTLFGLAIVMLVTTGCPPKRHDKKERIGRTRDGSSGNFNAYDSSGSKGVGGDKVWGQIVSNYGDDAFNEALYYFTLPSVRDLPEGDRLGYVSSQLNDRTGVRFWGDAVTTGGSGGSVRTFDPDSMTIHVEIYDDRTGSTTENGGQRAPIIVEISPKTKGFVSASGQMSGSSVTLQFTDNIGTIYLDGEIQGQYFVGTIAFSDGTTGNQPQELGQFEVQTCGFFHCN